MPGRGAMRLRVGSSVSGRHLRTDGRPMLAASQECEFFQNRLQLAWEFATHSKKRSGLNV